MVDGKNLYAYAGDNPMNRIDPSGHSYWEGGESLPVCWCPSQQVLLEMTHRSGDTPGWTTNTGTAASSGEKKIVGCVVKLEPGVGIPGGGVTGGPFASFEFSNCGIDIYGGFETPSLEISPLPFIDVGPTVGKRDRSGWSIQGFFIETGGPIFGSPNDFSTYYSELLIFPPISLAYSWKLWSYDTDWLLGQCK